MPDFGLEQNDDGKYTNVQECSQKGAHHPHVEGFYQRLQYEKHRQDKNYVKDAGVFPEASYEEKDDEGHHEDVQEVRPPETKKAEYAQHFYHSSQR